VKVALLGVGGCRLLVGLKQSAQNPQSREQGDSRVQQQQWQSRCRQRRQAPRACRQ
jgi:hypothetical protein